MTLYYTPIVKNIRSVRFQAFIICVQSTSPRSFFILFYMSGRDVDGLDLFQSYVPMYTYLDFRGTSSKRREEILELCI